MSPHRERKKALQAEGGWVQVSSRDCAPETNTDPKTKAREICPTLPLIWNLFFGEKLQSDLYYS